MRTLAAAKSRRRAPTDSAASSRAPGTPASERPPSSASPLRTKGPRDQLTPTQRSPRHRSGLPASSKSHDAAPCSTARDQRSCTGRPAHFLPLCSPPPGPPQSLPGWTAHEGRSTSARSWTRWPPNGGEMPARLTADWAPRADAWRERRRSPSRNFATGSDCKFLEGANSTPYLEPIIKMSTLRSHFLG